MINDQWLMRESIKHLCINNTGESRVRCLAKAQQFSVFYPLVKTNGN